MCSALKYCHTLCNALSTMALGVPIATVYHAPWAATMLLSLITFLLL